MPFEVVDRAPDGEPVDPEPRREVAQSLYRGDRYSYTLSIARTSIPKES